MTVAELIAALSEHPADALVVVTGFDDHGFEDAGLPRVVGLTRDAINATYDDGDEISAIVIGF